MARGSNVKNCNEIEDGNTRRKTKTGSKYLKAIEVRTKMEIRFFFKVGKNKIKENANQKFMENF